MHISPAGLHLIEQFEGYSGTRYLDAVGVPTIGFGTTAADIGTVPATCTRAQAEEWLRSNVARKYEPAVNALGVPMTQNQFDALVSLAYNCGPGAMTWDVGTYMRQRNYAAASSCFPRYVNAGGRVLQGLVNRRAAERRLFDTPDQPAMPVSPPVAKPKPHEILEVTTANGVMAAFILTPSGHVSWRQNAGSGWSGWEALGKP